MIQVRPSGAETFPAYAKIGPVAEMRAQAARMRQYEGLTAPVLHEFEGGYLMEKGAPLTTCADVVNAAEVLVDLWQYKIPHALSQDAQYFRYFEYLRERIQSAEAGAGVFCWRLLSKISQILRHCELSPCPAATLHGDATLANFVKLPDTAICAIDLSIREAPSTPDVDRSKFVLSLLGLHNLEKPVSLSEVARELPAPMRLGWLLHEGTLCVLPEFELHLYANMIRVATREPDKIPFFKEVLKNVAPQ
jgi:hypothetical protein